MSKKAKEATGVENPTVYADRGYFRSLEILACEQNGIVSMVPKTITSNSKSAGRFEKQDFNISRKRMNMNAPQVSEHRIASIVWRKV